MKLAVQWAGRTAQTVASIEELDAMLDDIERDGKPVAVELFCPGHDDPRGDRVLVQIGVGHPDRSFVLFDADGVWGVEPAMPVASDPIWFDYGGTPTRYGPGRTGCSPSNARQAAREFLAWDGARPSCVEWIECDPPPGCDTPVVGGRRIGAFCGMSENGEADACLSSRGPLTWSG